MSERDIPRFLTYMATSVVWKRGKRDANKDKRAKTSPFRGEKMQSWTVARGKQQLQRGVAVDKCRKERARVFCAPVF